jgi:DNA mismatch repair protein MutS
MGTNGLENNTPSPEKNAPTLKEKKKSAAAEKPSPVIAQYLELKSVNPGYILFYQLGDFYELFFDDAIEASEKLDLTLTKRGTYQGKDIPMAGVPLKVADEYLQKAIKVGFKVAVVEQMEDPADAKKRGSKAVVKRDVTRLVTPGTLTEDTLLEAGANNFLTALFQNPAHETKKETLYSLASLDISTGQFLLSEVKGSDLSGELTKLAPSELLIADILKSESSIRHILDHQPAVQTPVPSAYFNSMSGEAALKDALKVTELDGFGTYKRGELAAIAALLKYVELTQIGKFPLIRPPSRSIENEVMVIDAATRGNLELIKSTRMTKKGSLFDALDRTVTGAGSRQLAAQINAPLNDVNAINNRLNSLEFFINNGAARDTIRKILRRTPDMARSLSRLSLKRGGPKDLGAIRSGLIVADEVIKELENFKSEHLPETIKQMRKSLLFASGTLKDKLDRFLTEDLPMQARDGGFIKESNHDGLDEQRTLRDQSRTIIANLQATYRELTDIKSLKVRHNNQFGYFVEVTQLNANQLLTGPLSETFRHRQTLANNVRFNTEELIETESKITQAADRALAIELELFTELSSDVENSGDQISSCAESLAELDVILGLALLSEEENYTRPIVDNSRTFLIKNGRHPVVEQALRKSKSGPFIENNCELSKQNKKEGTANIWLLTGPNMAGKSTYLRQNALIAIIAQMGCFVPAASAHIGLIDRLFSRVGASDDLARGRSTFMVEMVETAAILNQATEKSLVILDEIGRGTATFDGLSIAWAAVEYLHNISKTRALFATHYHELTVLSEKLSGVTNATIEVKEWNDEIVFLHRVTMGAADRSYGIQVAKLAGLPKAVIKRANEVLNVLENKNQKTGGINQLEDLPLFSMELPEDEEIEDKTEPNPIGDKLQETLTQINPDDLTPKNALDLIYKLKTIAQ